MIFIVRLPFDITSFLVWSRNLDSGFLSKPSDQILALPFLVHVLMGYVSQTPNRREGYEPIIAIPGVNLILALCLYIFGWICLVYGWRFTHVIQEITLILLTGWAISLIWTLRFLEWIKFRSAKTD